MRKSLFLVVVLGVVLLLTAQALADFQAIRWKIIGHLADTERGFPVSSTNWTRNDLNDGTPRWMNEVKGMYIYELLGSPNVSKGTLLGELGGTEASGYELGQRVINFLEAMGVTRNQARPVSESLFNATLADPEVEYYRVSGGVRVELIYYDLMGMFMLVLSKE